MIISQVPKFVFIHCPKTGGTSITNSLTFHLKNLKPISEGLWHTKVKDLTQLFPETKDYFKFAFVRNTWDRIVSMYEFIKQKSHNKYHQRTIQMNFQEFIRSDIPKSQLEYIAINNNILVDFVGKYETLNEDYTKVCQILKLPLLVLKKYNITQRKPYQEYYSSEDVEYIKQAFSQEIQMFNYSF